jgi:4-hydroxy-tetrahydrodipicolinate synthase
LFQHFHAIACSTHLPIILYSIPGRCGIEIGVDTVNRLAHDSPNFVGIKEAGGNPDRVSQLRATLGHKFTILSGDDSLTLPFMSVGAQGVVSVASNVIPHEVVRMVRAFSAGNASLALKLHEKFYPLFKDLFIESNPGPAKAALAMMGMMNDEMRLPMVSSTWSTYPSTAATTASIWGTSHRCRSDCMAPSRTSGSPASRWIFWLITWWSHRAKSCWSTTVTGFVLPGLFQPPSV